MRDSKEIIFVPCTYGRLKVGFKFQSVVTKNKIDNALFGLSQEGLRTLSGHNCIFIVVQSQIAKSAY